MGILGFFSSFLPKHEFSKNLLHHVSRDGYIGQEWDYKSGWTCKISTFDCRRISNYDRFPITHDQRLKMENSSGNHDIITIG